jgi:hypothetical protein
MPRKSLANATEITGNCHGIRWQLPRSSLAKATEDAYRPFSFASGKDGEKVQSLQMFLKGVVLFENKFIPLHPWRIDFQSLR